MVELDELEKWGMPLHLLINYELDMARSQNAFIKKKREQERAKKKKEKQEKKEARKKEEKNGPEIDWESAPENKTLTQDEERQKNNNEKQSNNK